MGRGPEEMMAWGQNVCVCVCVSVVTQICHFTHISYVISVHAVYCMEGLRHLECSLVCNGVYSLSRTPR